MSILQLFMPPKLIEIKSFYYSGLYNINAVLLFDIPCCISQKHVEFPAASLLQPLVRGGSLHVCQYWVPVEG